MRINVTISVMMIAGKVMIIVMMKTTIVDVIGMEATVVIIMLTWIGLFTV